MSPFILSVGGGWRRVVEFTVQRLYPWCKTHRYTTPLAVDTQAFSVHATEEKTNLKVTGL
jgi:hypothetical protein